MKKKCKTNKQKNTKNKIGYEALRKVSSRSAPTSAFRDRDAFLTFEIDVLFNYLAAVQ